MSATHAANLLTARGTSSTDVLRYTWQSSAYMCRRRPWRATISSSSAEYSTYSSGPSTDPCGTPNSTHCIGDRRPQYETCGVRSARNERIHSSAVFVRPNATSIVHAAGYRDRRNRRPLRGRASQAVKWCLYRPLWVPAT